MWEIVVNATLFLYVTPFNTKRINTWHTVSIQESSPYSQSWRDIQALSILYPSTVLVDICWLHLSIQPSFGIWIRLQKRELWMVHSKSEFNEYITHFFICLFKIHFFSFLGKCLWVVGLFVGDGAFSGWRDGLFVKYKIHGQGKKLTIYCWSWFLQKNFLLGVLPTKQQPYSKLFQRWQYLCLGLWNHEVCVPADCSAR